MLIYTYINNNIKVSNAKIIDLTYYNGIWQKTFIDDSKLVIDRFGTKVWYNCNNDIHRIDVPAIECADGNKFWYINGKRHREDGPAVEKNDGTKSWWINGELHREYDQPAHISMNGDKSWWIHGELHRHDDKPAKEKHDGTREWYMNGVRHRIKGPAVIGKVKGYDEMIYLWYKNGQRHCVEGPAVVGRLGHEEWWIDGRYISG